MPSTSDAVAELPVALDAILAALATDARFSGPLALEPACIEPIHGHRGIFRIAIRRSGDLPSTVIFKRARRWEAEIQTRIATELDTIAPAVYGRPVPFSDPAEDSVGMLMEDLDGERVANAETAAVSLSHQLAAYGRAVVRLAAVHDHFGHRLSTLLPPRKLGVGLEEAVPEIPGLLNLLVSVVGLPLDLAVIEEIRTIGAHFEEYLTHCSSPESLTLMHGDFHLGNVMSDAAGEIRIIDWSTAATGPCEWDLVMCGEPQVAQYLQARSSIHQGQPYHGFHQRLKSAVVVRMYEFIRAAIGVVFADHARPFEALLMSIPLYAGRLTEAANSTRFSGGNPVEIGCRTSVQ